MAVLEAETTPYVCPYCDKECQKSFGLKNHMKVCKKGPKLPHPQQLQAIDNDFEEVLARREASIEEEGESVVSKTDIQAKQASSKSTESATNTHMQSERQSKSAPFEIGAFFIMAEHVPMMLDLDFAAALSEHILKNGSENKAILAFGHQLQKLAGED